LGFRHRREARRRSGVLALGHSTSALARIERLLDPDAATAICQPPPGWRGALVALRLVAGSSARTLYLVDVGISTTAAAVCGRVLQRRVVVDTGDAVYALARSLGDRSMLGQLLVGAGEQLALRSAHHVVVRGRAHSERIRRPTTFIPDVAPASARPVPAGELRATLDLQGAFVVGLVGSLILAPRLGVSYGWDLVEALPHTSSETVALIVGDGSGLAQLKARAHALGVADRCRFVGRVDDNRISEYVSAMDAAISTQTNDLVGAVRTTGKLPLYLACGCPVIASHVGEAALLLGPLGWTLRYDGVVDRAYPARLAQRLKAWQADSAGAAERRRGALAMAVAAFDVETMRARLDDVLTDSGSDNKV
jgi:glycosyltransferase involved in cell wall biosynthesis